MSKLSLAEALRLVRTVSPTRSRMTPQFASQLRPLNESNKEFKPLSEAPKLLPKQNSQPVSNVLLFRTQNQLLTASDFEDLWRSNPSSFCLGSKEDQQIKLIRSRDPHTLKPLGGYYLLFKSSEIASAFLLDNLGSELHGTNAYLEMVTGDQHLRYMQSSILNEKASLLNDGTVSVDRKLPRNYSVLVKGFPTFINKDTIEQMLWTYDLAYGNIPIRSLHIDDFAKVGMWLISFADSSNADRFVTCNHGIHFNGEKRLPKMYATVLD